MTDVASESFSGVLQRPGRSALTATGVLLGTATFVAVLGITATVAGRIDERFTALTATEVTVEEVPEEDVDQAFSSAFPEDADRRAARVIGVRHAGLYWTIPGPQIGPISSVAVPDAATDASFPVYAVSAGLFSATRSHVSQGRTFDSSQVDGVARVAVVGSSAARRLGLFRLDLLPAVYIDGVPFTVIGILDDVARMSELMAAILVPRSTAERLWGEPIRGAEPGRMLIETETGAARVVAGQIAAAVRPDLQGRFKVIAPPDPRDLREQVTSDVSALFLFLAMVCLTVGALSITNTMLITVMERVPEVGLRRAVGAARRHIALQFLVEGAVIGVFGGVVGASLGVLTVVGVAVANAWTPIIPPIPAIAAPLLGCLTGMLASVYPALRAARIDPAEALRR